MKEDDKVETDPRKNKHDGSEDLLPNSIATEEQKRGSVGSPKEDDSGKNTEATSPDDDARENKEDTIGIP